MSGAAQQSLLRQVLFNIFINDIRSGIERARSESADDTEKSGAPDRLEETNVIQRDPDRLEAWAQVTLMKSSKVKCKVLPLAQGNPCYQCRLGGEGIESSPAETGTAVHKILHYELSTWARKSTTSRASTEAQSREVILLLCSALLW